MTTSGKLLELNGVTKSFGGSAEAEQVLHGIDLSLGAGESLAIGGPSGSGKSTLLNIMGGLDRPTSGTVRLDGQDLFALDDRAVARVRNLKLGFVFQLHHLLPQCTALENVLVPTLVSPTADAGTLDRAKALLDRVGLGRRLHHRPGQLSGGERQRVAVARALVNRPALLLADEPTGSLDRSAAEGLAELLVELNRADGVALVLVTHSLELARRMGSVRELRDGVLGTPQSATRAP